MAKVSTNAIKDYSQDWSNDTETGLPFSGSAVQTFIKEELQKKAESADLNTKVDEQINSTLFGGGTRGVLTSLEGNTETLQVEKLVYEGGALVSKSETINIGTPDVNARFLSIVSQLSEASINVGGEVNLSYGFTVTDADGDLIPGSFSNVTMTLTKQGQATPFYTANLGSVESTPTAGAVNQTVNLTSILADRITSSATINVTLAMTYTYSYIDESGETQTKTVTKYGTVALTVLSLVLSTSINIANTGLVGQVTIPYTVRGNGVKSVYLYKNGEQVDSHSDITASTSSNVFTVSLENGSANYQLVAETQAGNTLIKSSSFYFDLFRSTSTPMIALLVEDSTGTIQGADYKTPKFNAPKFNDFKFSYYVYDPQNVNASLSVTTEELDADGKVIVSTPSEQTVARKIYSYSKKIKSSNQLRIVFVSGTSAKSILVNPLASAVNIELPTESLKLNLDADGRNNEETNPAVWNYGEVTTEFSGLNWQSNGWVMDEGSSALLLQNGAKALINFPLFQAVGGYPVTTTGCTFEILFKCKNATLDEHDLISCYWKNNNNKTTGLNITTSYVGVDTGEETVYTDDDGNETQRVTTRVGSQYAEGEYYKYTFVIDPQAPSVEGRGLCYGFLNGILSYVAPIPTSFNNLNKLPIAVDSTYADVYIKSIKYYDEALSFDMCVDGFIVDQPSSAEIESLYNFNSVLSVDGKDENYVSPQKLREKGHGVIIISPAENQTSPLRLQDLNASSDKKSYFGPFRIAYFAPEKDLDTGQGTIATKGNPYNFLHKACMIRVQGTTSTKRPRKNWRFQLDRKNTAGDKFKPDENPADQGFFIVGGEVNNKYKYSMSQGSVAVPLICAKVDYVDSSMTHNTGGAIVFNELTKNVPELRNPAQAKEFADGGNSVSAIKTRVSIDGFPVDIFAADSVVNPEYTDTLEDGNYVNLEYMGQYNFNNDKSKSGKVFGFDGAYTYDEEGNYQKDGPRQAICVEFLDNQAKLDNFQITFAANNAIDEVTTYSTSAFAGALEVRAPEDLTDQVEKYGLDSLTTYKDGSWNYVNTALKRVFNFVGECAKEVATNNGKSAYSLNNMTSEEFEALNWTSEKFRTQAKDYFSMESILAWYIWTDYLLAADQRAKNMMLYTMDGKHWMFQYYDGDTALGERNDCFLAYDYLTDRDTFDYGVNQYAMQGHDSWLWYLVRANFNETVKRDDETEAPASLATICQKMRASGKFSADYIKKIFNEQLVGNWSQRQYNYSQVYKYITPITERDIFQGTDIGINFINTAQGSREAHRSFTLENRFNLLDSKYRAGGYTSDAFVYYGNTTVPSNKLTIVSSIPYYFGWNKSNTPIQEHKRADNSNGYRINLTITDVGANNPANILGASRIKELHFDSKAAWTVDSTKTIALANLQKLVAKGLGSNGVGDMYLTGCPLLTYVDISNSNFTGLVGLRNSSKLEYLDVSGTKITSVTLADGSPISTMKLASPTEVYLSNLNNVVFQGGDQDTLTAEDWTNLNKLLINNCKNVNWELLLDKLLQAPVGVAAKYLRITGVNKTADITWLDQFNGIEGLDENGGEYTGFGAQLIGDLYLTEYTDDDVVATYQNKYPSIKIHQPEYTIIEADETVIDETRGTYSNSAYNYTNLDNNTGKRTSTVYVPSGHIKRILNNCHRYLGKMQSFGNAVTLVGNPSDTTTAGKSFLGRDKAGTMCLIQLSDENSTYYNVGYKSSATRKAAPMDGKPGNGEVYVRIPGFWYKGINFNTPIKNNQSLRYTCFSSQTEKPSISEEIRVIPISDLKSKTIGDEDIQGNVIVEGVYRENRILNFTEMADNVTDRLSSGSNTAYDIYRVTVEGYKKLRYPVSIGDSACCLFTDKDGKIIANSAGAVSGTGELYCNSSQYLYNGMPVIVTIPAGAVYFYISLKKYVSGSSSITTDPCDIVMHRGDKFASGSDMDVANAASWIADMEPDWQYSEPVCIAAVECAQDDSGLGLYTPFDGTAKAAVGSSSQENDLTLSGNWFQYSMRKAAYSRGLQLIDYEATKLIAMLFTAKYGRRNSQNVLGAGTSTNARKLGVSREYGMLDTVVPAGTSISEVYSDAKFPVMQDNEALSYVACGSPCFLGIENVQGNVGEWLDRAYYANETAADCGKLRITNPDLTERRVYSVTPSGNYPKSVVHGKYCDILSCSGTGATSTTAYCDYQSADATKRTTWKDTRAIMRSYYNSDAVGGVFSVRGGNSVGFSSPNVGSRLLFRGTMNIIDDVTEFESAPDKRE